MSMLIPIEPEKYKYVWCFHCERVALAETWLQLDECPYCRATPLDAYAWRPAEWPRDVQPLYPEEPVVGGYYPLREPEPDHEVGGIPPTTSFSERHALGQHGALRRSRGTQRSRRENSRHAYMA